MKLTATRKDTPIQMPATGTVGVVRRPAPSDGFTLDTGDDGPPVFLSERDVEMALVDLKMRRRSGWRR